MNDTENIKEPIVKTGEAGNSEGRKERNGFASTPKDIRNLSLQDLILNYIPAKGSNAHRQLKDHLQGKFVLDVMDCKLKFLLFWQDDKFIAKEFKDKNSDFDQDCTITLKEKVLREIILDELNPQLAMLASKVNVLGNTKLAVYFFNIFTR